MVLPNNFHSVPTTKEWEVTAEVTADLQQFITH